MKHPNQHGGRPPDGAKAVLRLAVIAFCLITMALYIGSIPDYYTKLVTVCISDGCGNSVPAMPLPDNGLSLKSLALLLILIDCCFTFGFYIAAAILAWKGFREPMGMLTVLVLVAFGTSFPSLTVVASGDTGFAHQWFMFVSVIGWISLALFFFLFPDGRFVPSWSRYFFILFVVVNVINLAYGGDMWRQLHLSEYLQICWYAGSTFILLFSQLYRYRRLSPPLQRQQTKWVVYGGTVGLVGFVVISMLFDPQFNDGSAMTFVYLNLALHATLLAIPVSLTMAVLRRRLWDIDPIVNRTLVYFALSICVVLLYTLTVLYLSRLFQTEGNFIVSLIATAGVAIVFAPLKEWLQRQINRLLKGRHDDPYSILLELGNQLIQSQAPEETLAAMARTVKEALRLPYVGISIGVGSQDTLVASVGEPVSELHAYPIIHRGQELGTLHLASRSPGEAFSSEDGLLLDVLLRQAGPIVENVNMTLGMKLLAEDLQESREKLVLAREEERRSIRKNLHDDLAPRLAALALNAATAQKYMEKEPAVAIEMLSDLRKEIRSTVDEIRTLVHDLRPPSLDELGLIGAIQERIETLSKPAQLLAGEQGTEALHIRLHAPTLLPVMPAAVEVAVYRIITESLVNVVKHAKATICTVRLEVSSSGQLVAEIIDNGSGIQARPPLPGAKDGIGLISIRERAAELGGQCTVERLEGGGTRIAAVFPL
ncbi:MAG: histidine kinase [Clostridia bacterium]